VVDEISLSRNFAKYLFRIPRNNLFISRNFVWQNLVSQKVTKFREMFVKKLNCCHCHWPDAFLNFLAFQYHQKITFMSKITKYLNVSGSVPKFHGSGILVRNPNKRQRECSYHSPIRALFSTMKPSKRLTIISASRAQGEILSPPGGSVSQTIVFRYKEIGDKLCGTMESIEKKLCSCLNILLIETIPLLRCFVHILPPIS
jgi:hypothetical protein